MLALSIITLQHHPERAPNDWTGLYVILRDTAACRKFYLPGTSAGRISVG